MTKPTQNWVAMTKPTQNWVAAAALLVTTIGLVWAIKSDFTKQPVVVLTREGIPASDAELVTEGGSRFSVGERTGLVHLPRSNIGEIIIVRDVLTGKELGRFELKAGRNEPGL